MQQTNTDLYSSENTWAWLNTNPLWTKMLHNSQREQRWAVYRLTSPIGTRNRIVFVKTENIFVVFKSFVITASDHLLRGNAEARWQVSGPAGFIQARLSLKQNQKKQLVEYAEKCWAEVACAVKSTQKASHSNKIYLLSAKNRAANFVLINPFFF